jgi:cytohesin
MALNAAQNGDKVTMRAALEISSEANNWTPLHFAAKSMQNECVKRASADKDAKDKKSCKPLHLAARDRQKDSLEPLLRAGAKITTMDIRGKTPLHNVAFGRQKRVKMPLRAIADTNAKNEPGSMPLPHAAGKGTRKA